MSIRVRIASILLAIPLALSIAVPARSEPAKCHKAIVKQLLGFKKKHLALGIRCLDKENAGSVTGPCPDPTTALKFDKVDAKVTAGIEKSCTMADLAALGFPSDCQLESATAGIEASCAALPVTTTGEFAECLKCWKGAELAEFVATLYASHALEVCGGDLGESSPVCSDLDCTTPLPDQRDLSDGGEYDCQRAIGKAGYKYILTREKYLEKCAFAGGTQASCLADATIQLKLDIAVDKRDAKIMKGCGNRTPEASPPFCCRTGTMNMCTAATTRDDCENVFGGQVQEGKICDVDNKCANPPGNQKNIKWWEFCPESSTCPGAALTSLDDLEGCVGTSAEAVADELLCFQFPGNGGADWPCPPDDDGSPSGAFVDGAKLFF